MKYSGGTFSGKKSLVCAHKITVVGHVRTPKGCVLDPIKVDKIVNWGPCTDLSKVCAFLGMVEVVHVFIKNFTCLTHLLTALMCKDAPFIIGLEQISTQDTLKTALLTSPTLHPINYTSNSPVILGIDTLLIAIGYLLCQCDTNNPHICHYTCFGLITLNDHELRFSQPKLVLYSLFHTLHSLKMYLIGVWNLIVEVNMQYIKGMLSNPDITSHHWPASTTGSSLSFSFTSLSSMFQVHGMDLTVSHNARNIWEMNTMIQSTIWSSMIGSIRYMASCTFLTLLIFRLLLPTKM